MPILHAITLSLNLTRFENLKKQFYAGSTHKAMEQSDFIILFVFFKSTRLHVFCKLCAELKGQSQLMIILYVINDRRKSTIVCKKA
jgi:hypothetical protein